MTRFVIGLLCLSLTACATTSAPDVLVRTVVEKQYPPSSLTVDTEWPVELDATNGDLLTTIVRYRAALKSCNDDKVSLRNWSQTK